MKNLFLVVLILIWVLFSCKTKQKSIDIPASYTTSSIAYTLKYPFSTKVLKLSNGIEITYSDTGLLRGTPLLFVHGLGSYMRAWDKNVASLAAEKRCIRLDLAGYGKSSKGRFKGNMTFYADLIGEFCAKLGLKKVILVGHSMGGQIALTTTMLYPTLVEKLILVDPAGFETFNSVQKITLKNLTQPSSIKYSTEFQIRQSFAANFYKMPDDAQFMIDDRLKMRSATDFDAYCYGVAQNVYGMLDEPVYTKLSRITQPALCFFGKNDVLIPNKFMNPLQTTEGVARDGATKMKNCTVVLLPEAGHFSMWEKADSLNKKVSEFLR
ncbi:MAG: alpha/beta hydrolase [Saprospiraceae bacterium]|nr:alpha/beta hydrolase [Saprospiraceae bacterium]